MDEKKEVDSSNNIIVQCPHCQDSILIERLNCRIFRHGILKDTGKQMDPHASKEICDSLFSQNLIYGCGKPFRITDVSCVEICDYI